MSEMKVTKTIPSNTYKVTVEYNDGSGLTETFLRVSFQNWYFVKVDGTLGLIDSAKESSQLETAFNQYNWTITLSDIEHLRKLIDNEKILARWSW